MKKPHVDFELTKEEDEFLGYEPGDEVVTQQIEDGIIFYKKGAVLEAEQANDSSETELD